MQYRALMFKNEGNAVRLFVDRSEVTESAETAMKFAHDLKLDKPAREYWTCVVSSKTAPQYFP